MSKEIADLLWAAREKIAAPERWTKDALARNARGTVVDDTDPTAVCWCIIGAMDGDAVSFSRACNALSHLSGYDLVEEFNDAPTTTHAMVLNLLDRVILAEYATP